MHTVDAVIQRLIDYLAGVDLAKLSMMDLQGYTSILTQLHGMNRKDYMEMMVEAMSKGTGVFSGVKEVTKDGRTD